MISSPGRAAGSLGAKGQSDRVFPTPCVDRLGHFNHARGHPPPSTSSHAHTQKKQASLPLIRGNDDDQSSVRGHTPTQQTFDNDYPGPTLSSLRQNTTLIQQPTPGSAEASPAAGLVSLHQADTSDDVVFRRENLAICDEINFAPSTQRLLEACKANRGRFLLAIGEAKAAFPNGQGWEAAIATKKENADIRDLIKIYHRFECHNIYKHVVEAGYHTGTHWIRDMRALLTNKLCQDFPERFQNQKAANKSLNWVDQGCKYQEWAGMFSEKPDFGFLIALPSDVSHSTYASLSSTCRLQPAS